MAPTVFLAPGFWEGPAFMEPLAEALRKAGLCTTTSSLRSNGTRPPAHATMADDIAGLRADLEKAIEGAGAAGVVLMLHSVAGGLGSEAMRGLDRASLEKAGRSGGVLGIIFLTAGLGPEGFDKFKLPCMVDEDDETTTLDFDELFFNDFEPSQAAPWKTMTRSQPSCRLWEQAITYCGWRDVPSTYILCELDKCIPAATQQMLAALAGAEVIRISAGHLAQISATEKVARVVVNVAESLAID